MEYFRVMRIDSYRILILIVTNFLNLYIFNLDPVTVPSKTALTKNLAQDQTRSAINLMEQQASTANIRNGGNEELK